MDSQALDSKQHVICCTMPFIIKLGAWGHMVLFHQEKVLERKMVIIMISKEILEIKKQFTPENCAITRMCGCYVDHEKNRKYEVNRSFLSLP